MAPTEPQPSLAGCRDKLSKLIKDATAATAVPMPSVEPSTGTGQHDSDCQEHAQRCLELANSCRDAATVEALRDASLYELAAAAWTIAAKLSILEQPTTEVR